MLILFGFNFSLRVFFWIYLESLRPGLLLLLTEESVEGHTRDLDNFETDAGDITDSVALTTESGDEDLVVFFDKVKATVTGDESADLLAVLDELDTDALSNGRVRLLGLDTAIQREKR